MNDFIPHKTTAGWLFHQERCVRDHSLHPRAAGPNTPFSLGADSHFKLYLFVWNESRATGRVVAFPAHPPVSATRCALHLVTRVQWGRGGLRMHLQGEVKAFH